MLVYLLFLKLFLVHGPVSGLLELQPPEVRLKQAQTQIRVVESEWRRVSLWYSEVFLGLRGSLELCRACERWERWQFVTSEMRTAWEGSETCSHVALDSLHNICSLFFSPLHDFSIYIHAWGRLYFEISQTSCLRLVSDAAVRETVFPWSSPSCTSSLSCLLSNQIQNITTCMKVRRGLAAAYITGLLSPLSSFRRLRSSIQAVITESHLRTGSECPTVSGWTCKKMFCSLVECFLFFCALCCKLVRSVCIGSIKMFFIIWTSKHELA